MKITRRCLQDARFLKYESFSLVGTEQKYFRTTDRLGDPVGAFRELDGGQKQPSLLRGSSKGVRRKREFTPNEQKDAVYWEKRHKNNEAARRSREKRRFNDFAMESQVVALQEENLRLHLELLNLKAQFGPINLEANTQQKQQIQDIQVRSLLHTQNGCWLAAQPAFPMDLQSVDLMSKEIILPHELLRSDPKAVPLFPQYDLNTWPAKYYNESTFFPTYHNNHVRHAPVLRDSQLPKGLLRPDEAGKDDPLNPSEDGSEQLLTNPQSFQIRDTSSNPPCVTQSCSALPHKLRIKSKSFHLGLSTDTVKSIRTGSGIGK